jgi:Tfp pilus assembly protein PilF
MMLVSRVFGFFVPGMLSGVFLIACGGSQEDITEPSESIGQNSEAKVETETEKLRDPPQLKSMDGKGIPAVKTPQPKPGCKLDGDLPAEISVEIDADGLHELGQEQILARQGALAVTILMHASKKAPKDAEIQCDLATALLQCRFQLEAVEAAERASMLEPQNLDIAANLAQVYQIAGRIPDAIEAYRKAIKIDSSDPATHNNLAVLLTSRGKLEEAEKEARAALNKSPQEVNYLINLGYILFRKQRLVDAEMILRRAVKVAPESAAAHNQLGLVLAAQKQDEAAKEEFRKSLEIDPDNKAAQENLKTMREGFDFNGPWDKKR